MNMIVKSFRKQIETLYSLAAYKATGIHLPCNCEPVIRTDHSPLTFKVDVAQQIYDMYKGQAFRFSEEGITPRSLAEETAIFSHDSPHVALEIDPFGNMLVTPTQLYYQQMEDNIIMKGKIQHLPVQVKGLEFKQGQGQEKEKHQSVLFTFEDLSLSSLRVGCNLQWILRKKIELKEVKKGQIAKYIDLVNLSPQEVDLLLSLNLMDLTSGPVTLRLPPNSPSSIKSSLKQPNITLSSSSFHLPPSNQWLSACFRNNLSHFQSHYKLSQSNSEVILFGEMFPDISLTQIRKACPESFPEEVNKAMRHSLGFDHRMAINLDRTGLTEELRFSSKLAGLESCSAGEELLLLLDCLGSDEINRCRYLLESIKRKGQGLAPSLALLQGTLDRIICL